MKTRELILIGFGFLIVTGLSLSFNYIQHTFAPLNSADEHLDEIISSSDYVFIRTHLVGLTHDLDEIMTSMPENKNPVWLFPTMSTDFLKMQIDANTMIASVDKISAFPKDSSAYHTGMLDINARSAMLKSRLSDASGFMYASPANLFFTLMLGVGIIGIATMWVKNEQ